MVPGSRSTVKSFKLQALEFPDQLKATSGKLQAWLNNNIGYSRIMTKKEKKELGESLELLKDWELIEIILYQAQQLEDINAN